jgi:hypothetical protein
MISALIPSYGRDYKSKTDLLVDLNTDKDFTDSLSYSQINSSDLINGNLTTVNIRYKNLTQVAVCNYNKTKKIRS